MLYSSLSDSPHPPPLLTHYLNRSTQGWKACVMHFQKWDCLVSRLSVHMTWMEHLCSCQYQSCLAACYLSHHIVQVWKSGVRKSHTPKRVFFATSKSMPGKSYRNTVRTLIPSLHLLECPLLAQLRLSFAIIVIQL